MIDMNGSTVQAGTCILGGGRGGIFLGQPGERTDGNKCGNRQDAGEKKQFMRAHTFTRECYMSRNRKSTENWWWTLRWVTHLSINRISLLDLAYGVGPFILSECFLRKVE